MTFDWPQVAATVLAKCATKDPFFPKPSQALALGWGEEFGKWNLTPELLLEGVSKMYGEHGSGFRPLPKDVIDAARAIRRDRSEREDDAARREREALIDAKAEGRRVSLDRYAQGFGVVDQPSRRVLVQGCGYSDEEVGAADA